MNAARRDGSTAAVRESGFTLKELETYWEKTHGKIAREQRPAQAIVEGNPRLVNLFDDFAHRLGMRTNFRRLGRLEGRRVLDLGCGRGRWAEEFARRGAQVTGIDWSAEALEHARIRVPQAAFVRMPITDLGFSRQCFEVVNCVTVIQHLPYAVQASVLREAARVLVPGGMLSLVELTADQPGPHVFPRPAADWVALARDSGFAPMSLRGCCYELVFRPYKAVVNRLRSGSQNSSGLPGIGSQQGVTWRQRANRLVMAGLALPAFPVELFSMALPASAATHAAMIFRRVET
jgi:ubiquinone/menaquinone biosynthesis C-methylase UbiE